MATKKTSARHRTIKTARKSGTVSRAQVKSAVRKVSTAKKR
jgi:hypothetical protein